MKKISSLEKKINLIELSFKIYFNLLKTKFITKKQIKEIYNNDVYNTIIDSIELKMDSSIELTEDEKQFYKLIFTNF